MNKQLLLINQEKIEEAYNQEYLNELINYYNNILGYQGVTKAEIVICNRNNVNRNSDLQPKLYSISPDDVDRIIQLYKSYDLDVNCELQLITNKSLWDESEKVNEDESHMKTWFSTLQHFPINNLSKINNMVARNNGI